MKYLPGLGSFNPYPGIFYLSSAMKHAKYWFSILLGFSSILLLVGCENDIETINEVVLPKDTMAVESAFDVDMKYSEKGHIQFQLLSPQLDRFNTASPYVEFPQGIHVVFFDSIGGIKSEMTSRYAISYENKKLMEASEDVEIVNHEMKQQLNTEHLIWDQKKHIIFSEVFVKITTEDQIIFGDDGFESDEEFNKWTIRKPSALFDVDSDDK